MATSASTEVLAKVPLFVGLDDKELGLLAERVDVIELTEGKILFQYGDPGDWMVVIMSGAVELSVKTKTGEKVFLERSEPGDFFGEISLLDMGPRTATATVLDAGEAIVIDRGDLEELLRLKPSSALDLVTATGKRLRATQHVLRNTAARNVNEESTAADRGNIVLRVADWVANFSGSITFLVLHIFFFAAYIMFNTTGMAFDPFPYNFLTMTVSLEAIILSTLLLFSSNREGARERIRSNIEYDVNLKAELQISALHEKVDSLHAEVLSKLEALDPNRRTPGAAPAPPREITG